MDIMENIPEKFELHNERHGFKIKRYERLIYEWICDRQKKN